MQLPSLCLAVSLLASAPSSRPTPASPKAPSAATRSTRRELVRRPLAITDSNATTIPEIHVAAGVPTTLVFAQPLKDSAPPLLANVGDLFFPLQYTTTSIILVPRRDVGSVITTLNVTLADGTALPFKLLAAAKTVDLQVDVSVNLEVTAAPDSLGALKASVAQLRADLDKCRATAGDAGLHKVADLIVAQDPAVPIAFLVERRNIHTADKQARLLVEARQLYRLFGYTYLVTTIENRDPTRAWLLDKPELRVEGGSEIIDVKLSAHTIAPSLIDPGETARLVIVYPTPARESGQRMTLNLREKNGSRHVTLSGLEL